jgi:hypothetical protein
MKKQIMQTSIVVRFQNIFTEPHDLKFLKNFLKPLSKLIIYSIINNAHYKQYKYITFFSDKSSDDLLIILSYD